MKAVKDFFNRLGDAIGRMVDINPVITVFGIVMMAIVAGGIIIFLVVKAPLVAITVLGVTIMWGLVLFISKLVEEMKR